MAETTTTTTTVKPEKEDKANTGNSKPADTGADGQEGMSAAELEQNRKGSAAGNSGDNDNPSREESLREAGKASPNSPDRGIKDGTQVLGADSQSAEDRLEQSRREAVANHNRERNSDDEA